MGNEFIENTPCIPWTFRVSVVQMLYTCAYDQPWIYNFYCLLCWCHGKPMNAIFIANELFKPFLTYLDKDDKHILK